MARSTAKVGADHSWRESYGPTPATALTWIKARQAQRRILTAIADASPWQPPWRNHGIGKSRAVEVAGDNA